MSESPDWMLGPDVVFTRLSDDEAVLLHLHTKRYYSLNETGTLICDQLEQQRALPEIAEALCTRYALTRDEALDAAARFVEHLHEEGLAQPCSAA